MLFQQIQEIKQQTSVGRNIKTVLFQIGNTKNGLTMAQLPKGWLSFWEEPGTEKTR
jgi:hypothetical protein